MFSNAYISKYANDSAKKALKASDDAEKGKDSHENAAKAHDEAAQANMNAGNINQAHKHTAMAAMHREKMDPEIAANEFAKTLADHADKVSKKADMALATGKVSKDEEGNEDPRSATNLHGDAAKAHQNAAQAFKIAGKKNEAKYHAGKAHEHAGKMVGSAALSAVSSES